MSDRVAIPPRAVHKPVRIQLVATSRQCASASNAITNRLWHGT